MNYATTTNLLGSSEPQLLDIQRDRNLKNADIECNTTTGHTEIDSEKELERLTIDQAARILGITPERVSILIGNNTLCSGEPVNGEATLIAACVRAQAGKSRSEFMREVKRLITGENAKKCRLSVTLPPEADVCLQELFDDAAAAVLDGDGKTKHKSEINVRGIARSEITAGSVESLLKSLDFSGVRLEGAMYRIGYLEAKVASLEEELKELPELRGKFARSLILERENHEYLQTIAKQENELIEIHSFLDRIRNSWWCRLWCWLSGAPAA